MLQYCVLLNFLSNIQIQQGWQWYSKLYQRAIDYNYHVEENQKNPERLATQKGQNIQNLDNTKKRSEELEEDLKIAEERYNKIYKRKLKNLLEGKPKKKKKTKKPKKIKKPKKSKTNK